MNELQGYVVRGIRPKDGRLMRFSDILDTPEDAARESLRAIKLGWLGVWWQSQYTCDAY